MEDKGTYTKEEVIDALRIISDELYQLEMKRDFCKEHSFNYETSVIDSKLQCLMALQSKMKRNLGLTGEYINPSKKI